MSATAIHDLATLLATDAVHSIYQPIVDLRSRRTIAFEALARGPVGSALHSPAALFAAANAGDCLAELDRACRAAAVAGALDAGLSPPTALFVNLEPASAGVRYEPRRHAAVLDREWDIAVLGPHFAAALVAADLRDDGPDTERRFRFVLTFDRDLVSDVVAALMSRVIAKPAPLLAAAAA